MGLMFFLTGIVIIIYFTLSKNWGPGIYKFYIFSQCFLLINFRDYNVLKLDSLFVEKLLILLSIILCMITYGIKKSSKKIYILLGCIFTLNLWAVSIQSINTYSNSITAFGTVLMGIAAYSVSWKKECKKGILKFYMYSAIISAFLGIFLASLGMTNLFNISEHRFNGAAGSAIIYKLAIVGIISCLIYKKKFSDYDKHIYAIYINYLIVGLTLTRGAILFATILMLPEIKDLLKKAFSNKKYMVVLISIFGIGFPILYKIYKNVLVRSYTSTGELITSGRDVAWNYYLSWSTNRWLGNGFGFVKVISESGKINFTAVHNEYIRFYIENGIIGGSLVAVLFLSVFVMSYQRNKKGLKVVVFISMIGFLFFAVFDNPVSDIHAFLGIMTCYGIMTNDSGVYE